MGIDGHLQANGLQHVVFTHAYEVTTLSGIESKAIVLLHVYSVVVPSAFPLCADSLALSCEASTIMNAWFAAE